MTAKHDPAGRSPASAFLSHGFRPFFLLGSAYAAVALPIWLAMLYFGLEPRGPFDGVDWHVHEMIFGYLAAIMAGFALTAIPNWTGRLPVSGYPLAALVALWAIGRLGCGLLAGPLIPLVADCAFLFVLAGLIWREIVAGRNFRNLPVAGLFSLLALANLAFHLEAGVLEGGGYGLRLALAVAAMTVALIGGRVVPSFTRNWMAKMGAAPLPAPFGAFDKAALGATLLALAIWVAGAEATIAGSALVAAAAINTARMARWRGHATVAEPMVLVLHLGFLWLCLGLLLMGLAVARPELLGLSTALHALTAGAFGTMTLAVVTRASLGHTGRAIRAGPATIAIFAMVNAGAGLRLAASFADGAFLQLLMLGGLVWAGAFALFAIAYGPALLGPRAAGG